MNDELIEVVDRNNKVIGLEKRNIVHKKGLLHRASHVFIQNSNKQILLQKRSAKKQTWPNKWDLSMGETLLPGETFLAGAIRGIEEELGIKNISLTKIRDNYFNEYEDKENKIFANCFFQLFLGEYNIIEADKTEVAEAVFYQPEEIDRMTHENPDKFTPWLLYDWDYSRKKKYI